MKDARVVVIVLGIASPLGKNLDTFRHLLSKATANCAVLLVRHAPFSSCLAGKSKTSMPRISFPGNRPGAWAVSVISRSRLLSWPSATLSWTSNMKIVRRWPLPRHIHCRTPGAFAAHDSRLRHQHLSPFTMASTFPNAVSGEIAIALGINGESETYSIGCSSIEMPSAVHSR